MAFTTDECAWAQTSITFLGRRIQGLRGWSFSKTKEDDYLYGEGDEPIDIQTGNKAYPCMIKLLKYEVDMMNDAALAAGFADITEVPHPAISITCVYRKTATSKARTIVALAVKIGDITAAMEQNARMTEVTLPGKAMNITFR